MTTNKPEVVGLEVKAHGSSPLIRLSDYEALAAECDTLEQRFDDLTEDFERCARERMDFQAECEKLRKRARTTEREYSKALRTLKDLERVAKVVSDNSDEVCSENNQRRVECEQLRKDAQAGREGVKLLNYLFARNIIAMQSAVIEWEKGKGAAAGMQWIWNTLFGPGQIPDEDETDAQAYFDREIEPLDAAREGDQL